VWARYLPSLRPGGLGATIAGAVRTRDLLGWIALLAAACIALPVLALAIPLIAALALAFRSGPGGMTGDVHGAGIELLETGLLLAFAVQAAV
jgi:adenosylcobinamide-GDP ribazoletransferase